MKNFVGYFRILPWFTAFFLSVLAAGCGGSGQAPILGAGPDVATLLPTVTSAAPLPDAVGVSVNTKVLTAVFSKAMDPNSLTSASFTLNCPAGTQVTGDVDYVAASNSATLTLPAGIDLPPFTRCTATVTTAAKDTMGIPLATSFAWIFVTGGGVDTTAPRVTGTTNANGSTGVPINAKAGATFSEAMAPQTVIDVNNFTIKTIDTFGAVVPVTGTVSYSGFNAVFNPSNPLAPSTLYTATIKGGIGGVTDIAGNSMVSDKVWSWTTGTALDTTAPTVTLVDPTDGATNVAITTQVTAAFSKAMDPSTISTASFTVGGVTGTVAFNAASSMATFTPSANLTANTLYTATVTTTAQDLAGNALAVDEVWRFTTAATPVVIAPTIDLGTAAQFGTFGGSAGMTNDGIRTIVNGFIGSVATGTSMITGFRDSQLDEYTITGANNGFVTKQIYTCTNSTSGPTSTGPNAASCLTATNALLDARVAYLKLVAMPPGANPGENLGGQTLFPGVYTAPSGSLQVVGSDLTLDAQGDANAVWVFQMASTLTVGAAGPAGSRSIILAGGAQAKNVYWQVGSFATINPAGGGTMVGTIISQEGAAFSTTGNNAPEQIVTLEGRVLSLGASVTLVNTIITTP